ncbi:MAG: hypothetical protein AB1591_04605 [Pseudomonadota bacterium]
MNMLEQYFKVLSWTLSGRPFPPPHLIKQKMIRDALRQYQPRIMVETGTLLGDMVEAMKHRFERIYSIEISPELARRAQQRFANDRHVTIIENDSAIALRDLVHKLEEPALFWLDGHYSGGDTGKGAKETPIMEELEAIFSSPLPHVVLVDDARCFGSEKDYPTLAELETYVRGRRTDAHMFIKHDCIHILPAVN